MVWYISVNDFDLHARSHGSDLCNYSVLKWYEIVQKCSIGCFCEENWTEFLWIRQRLIISNIIMGLFFCCSCCLLFILFHHCCCFQLFFFCTVFRKPDIQWTCFLWYWSTDNGKRPSLWASRAEECQAFWMVSQVQLEWRGLWLGLP